MEKKLTSQGPIDRHSYTVTLPKEWIIKEKLDKTKIIELEVVGNKVILSPNKNTEEKVELNIDSFKDCLPKALQGFYREGIEELRLKYHDEKLIDDINNFISKNLIGYEIVEQKGNELVVRYIVKESEEDFKIVLRRIFLLLLELVETRSKIKVNALQKNISRLINYCERILIKKGHTEYQKIPFYYLLLDNISKFCDELYWFLISEYRTKKHDAIIEKISKNLNNAYKLFYKFETEEFNQCCLESYRIKNSIKLSGNIDTPTMHIHNLARLLNSVYGIIFIISFKHKDE